MREIKFRGWDKENKKMIYDDFVAPFSRYMTWNGGHVYKAGKIQPYIMFQYIGLKDKNGKEAYHKDRVSFQTTWQETGEVENWLGCIEWDDEDLCWCVYNDSEKWCVVKFRFIDWFEIIGNEFENPELLENDSDK